MSENSKIMIIDDDEHIMRSLSVRLSAVGFDVHTALDGTIGCDMIEHIVPDVILLDMRMRDMNGLAVLRKLKSQEDTRAIPVIAVSADVVERSRVEAISAGAASYIAKPYQFEKLLSAINRTIFVDTAKPSYPT